MSSASKVALPDPAAPTPSVLPSFCIHPAGLHTPRSSLDDPNAPNSSVPDLAKVALQNDLGMILDPASEEESHTPQATSPVRYPDTPPPSLPKPSRSPVKQSLVLPDVFAQVNHFLNHSTCSDTSLHVPDFTLAMLQELDGMDIGRKMEGENVRRSLFDNHLFLEYPTRMHEIVPIIFTHLGDQGTHIPDGLRNGASTDIYFPGALKTPDFSIYEVGSFNSNAPATAECADNRYNYPTVVFEVAYSQTLPDVSKAAARIIALSAGAVRLVVAIKVQYNSPKSTEDGDLVRKPIETVMVDYWMLTGLDELGPEDYQGKVGCLLPVKPDTFHYIMREDGEESDDESGDDESGDDEHGSPGGFTRLHIGVTESHIILPKDSNPSSLQSMDLCHYHLFRSAPPPGVHKNAVLLSIPYTLIHSVLQECEAAQAKVDVFNKKGTKQKQRELLKGAKSELFGSKKAAKRQNTGKGSG